MKRFISSLFILLHLYAFTLLLPSGAAAAPGASFSLTRNRRYVTLRFTDLKTVSKIDYTLVYDTSRGQKGFAGGLRTKRSTRAASRTQILGTCSSGYCSYQYGVKNLTLQTIFTLRSGGTSTVTRSLP